MSAQWLGIAGTALVAAAYVPQVLHIIRARCAGGVSVPAYLAWSSAAAFLLAYAVASGDAVFIVLQMYQLVALSSIALVSFHHRGSCDAHCGESARTRRRVSERSELVRGAAPR